MGETLTFKKAKEVDAKFHATLANKILVNKAVEGVLFSIDLDTPIHDGYWMYGDEVYKTSGHLQIFLPEDTVSQIRFGGGNGIIFTKLISSMLGLVKYSNLKETEYRDDTPSGKVEIIREGMPARAIETVDIEYPEGQTKTYKFYGLPFEYTYDDFVSMLKEYEEGTLQVICEKPWI